MTVQIWEPSEPAPQELPAEIAALEFGIQVLPADPYQAYLDRLDSPRSKRVMAGALDHLAQMVTRDESATGMWRPWWLLRWEHANRLRAMLLERRNKDGKPYYSPARINTHLSALRGVLKACWQMRLMDPGDYATAVSIENIKAKRLPSGRNIHNDEIAKLLAACATADGAIRYRDSALITVLESTGMRRQELADVVIEDYDARERSIRVIGKGNKERFVYVHKDAAPHLERWLALLGERRGPMFRAVDKHGRIGGGISAGAVGRIIERRYRQAEVHKLRPHDFRRTFIAEMLDAGADVLQVRQAVGHESSATTDRYDLRGQRGIRDAVDRMRIVLPLDDPEAPSGAGAP